VRVVADATRLRQLLSKYAPHEALLEQYFAGRGIGKRILADLPRLQRGEGYLWAPGREVL
jgi:hypothetical protein